ncbi:Osteoclast-stimulating factor 1 [Quaeritorhiza haematococci]|nr:Osteoclast-stimulating factor 1 [Quaeritorhiza haematococci]
MAAPPPRPSRPGKKEIQVVRALYDYTAQNSDELSFREGDVIYVLEKNDANWWKCRCGDSEGLVPSNYVGENTAEIENPLHEAAKRALEDAGENQDLVWLSLLITTFALAAWVGNPGNIPFVQELLAAGVSVNGLDRAGNAPLHWACRGGHSEVVRLLLEKNPAINSQNKLGDTPLHLAAWGMYNLFLVVVLGGNVQVINLLLSQPSINPTLRNKDNKVPLDIAKNDDVAAVLMQFTGTGYAAGFVGEEDEDSD